MAAEQIGLILKGLNFAAQKHRDQRRKDQVTSPYINHPITLAHLLWNEAGVKDATIVTAALLHDTVEDTQTTLAELEQEFGPEIACLVSEVTDDKSLPKSRRKQLQVEHAPHLSSGAKLVKLADKTANLRDLSASPPADWSAERKQEYLIWAKSVVDQLRGTHSELELLFDQAYEQGLQQV